tara:strand:- start:77227 stop:79377 length:2151 start_codon:yes stop_codon:yes gene_type:complete
MNGNILLSVLVFISSFLLFQLELIVAKIFLPNFGGSYMVWGACVVFFQAILLLGYFLVWKVFVKLGIKMVQMFYLSILILSLIAFPLTKIDLLFEAFKSSNLVFNVFLKLTITIGIVFLALSMTSVLCQYWASGIKNNKANVYNLFAISNVGSFAGLISYPFFIEPNLGLIEQQNIWALVFYGFIILYIISLLVLNIPKIKRPAIAVQATEGTPFKLIVKWLLFSAGGVVSFLAINNIMTTQIAPMPLIWMMPLAIYLLSFVIAFSGKFKSLVISKHLGIIISVALVYYFLSIVNSFTLIVDAIFYLSLLLVLTVFFHSKLFESKPEPLKLGEFYSYLGLGSLMGSLIVTWVFPIITNNYFEYFFALILVSLSMFESMTIEKRIANYFWPILIVMTFFAVPKWFHSTIILVGLVLAVVLVFVFLKLKNNHFHLLMVVVMIGFCSSWIETSWENKNYVLKHRNFYGISKVYDTPTARFLENGGTIHGGQILQDKTGKIPLVYYHPASPSAEIIKNFNGLKNMAIVGLGSGALATYCSEDQELDFYELDSYNETIARKYFPFIKNAKGSVQIIFGDARQRMQKLEKKYDLIIVDAFNGDTVPTHLLTAEAIKMYEDLLTENGVLLMHLTNRYVNLKQVFVNTVNMKSRTCYYKLDDKSGSKAFRSEWMGLIKKGSTGFDFEKYGWAVVSDNRSHPAKAWTDSYNYLLPYIEIKNLFKR